MPMGASPMLPGSTHGISWGRLPGSLGGLGDADAGLMLPGTTHHNGCSSLSLLPRPPLPATAVSNPLPCGADEHEPLAAMQHALSAMDDALTAMDGVAAPSCLHGHHTAGCVHGYVDEFEDELMAHMDVDDDDGAPGGSGGSGGSGDLSGCSPTRLGLDGYAAAGDEYMLDGGGQWA